MAKTDNLTDFLTDVASAIRTKTGTQALINPQNFSSEIAGIPTGGEDFTLADATPADVANGKTFYAGNATLKTGTNISDKIMRSMLWYSNVNQTQPDRISVTMPSDGVLPSYFTYQNTNPVDFYFSSNITIIPTYSFYGTKNFNFPNFASLNNLINIDSYAFYSGNKNAFNMTNGWPANLKVIESRAFQETMKAGIDLILPNSLERMGMYALCSTAQRVVLNTISIPHYAYYMFGQGNFYFVSANCDFVPNSCITSMSQQFNYRGSFNNVVIPTTCTRIENYAFGAQQTDVASNFHMNSMIFLSTTPPYFGSDTIATQHLKSGFKIYVPDSAVTSYQTMQNFAKYSSYVESLNNHPGFTITYNLTNCTSDNNTATATVGTFYTANITPNTGYTLDGADVSVKMGNVEHKLNFYSRSGANGVVKLANDDTQFPYGIVGDLVITITAVPET